MKIAQILLIFISLFKYLNCEIVVDVKVLDSNKNALNPEQIEHIRFLTVEFWRGGEAMYSFDLRRDIPIVSPDFEAYEQDKDGNPVRIDNENMKKNCYFSGTVEGFHESMAAMTFCHGITGHFMAGESSYQVNEVMIDSTPSFSQATLYKQKASNLTFACGVKTVHTKQKEKKINKRSVADMGNEIKIIELYLIANNDVYKSFGNVPDTIKYIKTLVLMANLYYTQVNFFLVAKHIDVWSDHDKFDTSNFLDGEGLLNSFISYKKQSFNHVDHDAAILFISSEGRGRHGSAKVNTVCRLASNVGWVRLQFQSHRTNMNKAMHLAHELGHILGIHHDGGCIPRPLVQTVMAGSYMNVPEFMYVWSECSIQQLKELFVGPKSFCLLPYQEYSTGECGDGIVNEGEECDNFGMLDRAQKKCCDPRTCKLIGDAKCWRGLCCDVNTCQFKGTGTVCRDGDGLCDEDDVCNGSSSTCRNKFKKNGKECSHKAYCFKGKCQTRSKACENLFNVNYGHSPNSCYNSPLIWKTDLLRGVNCGFDSNKNRIACDPSDRQCGSLLCKLQGSNTCTYSRFEDHINYNNISRKYVPEGSYCGENKFCIRRKCISRPLYMVREFEKYGDTQYSYDDQEVDGDFTRYAKVISGASSQDLSSLFCGFLMINLLLSFQRV